MTKDLNKGISSIEYNLLNLPSRITYSDGRMADYVYSATGAKLSVTYTNGIRFTTIDPMAEKYYGVSPYAYCGGNPIPLVDPNGKEGFAQNISRSIKDAVIIAPEQNVYTANGVEKGTYFESIETTKDFSNDISRWKQYEKGEKTNVYKGNTLPGSTGYKYITNQSSMLDKLLDIFGL